MKANTAKKTQVNKDSNGNVPLLSVGMIVKNEEKYLEKCLKALMPLTKDGKAEIIVVDTGSTDNTVTIAKKYTDKVFYFKWINDFAAARNYGLDRATGEWFMFIDADEIFDETVMEIMKFLESPEQKKYNSASYHIRNYSDDSLTRYDEFIPTRIGRRQANLRFVGSIHECLTLTPPTKIVHSYVYHYGYVGQKLLEKKSDRNLKTLFQDYENNPKDARTLMYIYNGLFEKNDKEKYLLEWVELANSTTEDRFTMLAYLSAAQFYAMLGDWRKAAYYCEKTLTVDNAQKNVKSLMAYFHLGDSHVKLLDFKLAIKDYENYFEKYKQYNNDQLDLIGTSMLSGIREDEYTDRRAMYAFCLAKDSQNDAALKVIKPIDPDNLTNDGFNFVALTLSELCNSAKEDYKFSKIRPVLEKYIADLKRCAKEDEKNEKNISGKIDNLTTELYWRMKKEEKKMGRAPLDRDKVASVTAEVLDCLANSLSENYEGIMFDGLNIVSKLPEDAKTPEVVSQLIQPLLDSFPDCKTGYSPMIWEAVLNNLSLCSVLSKSNRKTIEEISAAFSANIEDYVKIVKEFVEVYQPETIKELYFEISLLRRTLKDHEDMWYPYSMLLANYVSNIYTEDILNDDDITVLSDEERLGYYMYKADGALQVDDKMEYIHYLRLALDVCPGMKESIKEIADGMDIGEEEDK